MGKKYIKLFAIGQQMVCYCGSQEKVSNEINT